MREVVAFARPPHDMLARLSTQPLLLMRGLATPNFELLRFLDVARKLRRPPLIGFSPHDWFTPSVNASKRALGRLRVQKAQTPHGAAFARPFNIVDLNAAGRKRMDKVACGDGTSLPEFHARLCAHVLGDGFASSCMNTTDFRRDDPSRPYYERIFALLTCVGVLAESYVIHGPEQSFTEDIVLPAFEACERRFEARPMIVPLLPAGTEMDPYWESYPPEVLPLARAARWRDG